MIPLCVSDSGVQSASRVAPLSGGCDLYAPGGVVTSTYAQPAGHAAVAAGSLRSISSSSSFSASSSIALTSPFSAYTSLMSNSPPVSFCLVLASMFLQHSGHFVSLSASRPSTPHTGQQGRDQALIGCLIITLMSGLEGNER